MSPTRTDRFDVDRPPTIDAELPDGDVAVASGPDGQVTVEVRGPDADRYETGLLGGSTVTIRPVERRLRWRRHRILILTPVGTRLEAFLAGASVEIDMELAGVNVAGASGDVHVADVKGDCTVATVSGNVRVGRVGGTLSTRSVSGDIAVAAARGQARAQTVSGDIRIGTLEGPVAAKTVSGDLDITNYCGTAFEARSTSGSVRVGLPTGRNLDVVLHTLSGKVRSNFPVNGDRGTAGSALDGRLEIRTLSGNIELSPAPLQR